MALPELSARELEFIQEYVRDRNGTRAVLVAGLSTTYEGANQKARTLLQNPQIREWIKYLLRQQARALKFKPGKVLRNWMLASTADLTYYEVDGDGRLHTAPGVPREYLRCVRKLKQTRSTHTDKDGATTVDIRTEIELRDPFGPETKLMEHYGELQPEGTDKGLSVELLTRLAALGAARQPQPGGTQLPQGGAAVEPESGAAGPGVPQPG